MPSMIRTKKKAIFNYLTDEFGRIYSTLVQQESFKGQREKCLIIKYVAQSITTYCMSNFLLPSCLCDEIQRKLNSFWWDSNRINIEVSSGLTVNV